jgi:hypothetical protein
MKMRMSCHKSKQTPDQSKKCNPDQCNPFMACSLGNFFLIERKTIESSVVIARIKKIFPENDNRLAYGLSECWHPPESI